MRILHIYSGNLFGGIETMLLALAAQAVDHVQPTAATHEFALCFDERLATELRALAQPVHLLGPVRVSRPTSAHHARQALDALLRSRPFDRVVCHAPWSLALFGGVARRRGIPLVFWAHDRMTGRHWTERLARHVAPDLVISNSAFTAATQASLFPGVRSAVVHPPARFGFAQRERRYVRMSLETPADAVVIVQASRCEAWKGHRVMLEALASLRELPHWVWWVAGGPQRPDERAFMSDLRDTAVRLGIGDRVRWLGQRSDVATVLAAADLYAQANLDPEPFGLAFVEALAAGLPVVAANDGGVREIVDDTCGRLVAPGDVIALAGTLSALVVDASLRQTLSAAAPARARAIADPRQQADVLARRLADMATPLELAG